MKSAKLTIQAKLITGLCLCAIILLLVGWFGLHGQSVSNAAAKSIYADNLTPILKVAQVRSLELRNQVSINAMLLKKNAAYVQITKDELDQRNKEVDEAWNVYYPAYVSGDEESKTANGFIVVRKRADALDNHILQLAGQGNFDEAATYYDKEASIDYGNIINTISELVEINHTQAKQAYEDSNAAYLEARTASMVAIAVGLIVMLTLLVVLVRAISHPLKRAVNLANAIASGKLNHNLVVDREDEIGRLLHALHTMDEQLTRIVTEVRHSSNAVATASSQISQGNDDLSRRTQEQASSLEETAASMEEITSTVKQNAENAAQAAQLVTSSLTHAESGAHVAARASAAMSEIHVASQRIEEIVTLMDEISFQTNLLALNAAVEAARAGDQGRGFAVVAVEVRNLAQRSKTASREIKGLINDSSEKVETGRLLVTESGQALQDIHGSIRKVNDLVAEIAAASNEQSAGIDQVNVAVSGLDEVTQQNAALVEEAAAASRSMQEQASELLRQVDFFEIRNMATSRPAAAAHRPPSSLPVRPPSSPEPEKQRARELMNEAIVSVSNAEWKEF